MHKIVAKYKWGQKECYTMDVFPLLRNDPDVEWVVDAETEELLYMAEDFVK